jgi:hypothetical protein
MGGPGSSISYRQHSSWDHVTTQAHHYVQVGIPSGGGSEKPYSFYCSPDIFRFIRSRKLSWNGSVARTGTEEYLQIFVELPDDKRLLVEHVYIGEQH